MQIFIGLSAIIIRRLWVSGLVALLLAGVISGPSVIAQDEGQSRLTVIAPALNVRSGPGVSHPAIGLLRQGDQVAIVGYDAATTWWQVQLPNGQTGWVSSGAAYVMLDSDGTGPAGVSPVGLTPNPSPTSPTATNTVVFQTASGGPLYAINADGSNLRYLATGMDPALSPDGQSVAFTRWDNPQIGALGSLWLINVNGGPERLLHEGIYQPKAPTWSPDGRLIILSMTYGDRLTTERKCSGERPPRDAVDIKITIEGKDDFIYCYTLLPKPYWGLRQVEVATGQFQDINPDTNSISPTWDPANPWRLVYDGQWGLVSLDLNQRTSWPLTQDFNDRSPIFSPDGSKIAVSYRQDDHWEIHVLNADGSGPVRLTQTSYQVLVQQELNGELPHSFNNAAPTWSPDGSQVAFLTDRTGQWEIWVMNADGTNQRPLFPPGVLAGLSLQYNGVDERVLSWR